MTTLRPMDWRQRNRLSPLRRNFQQGKKTAMVTIDQLTRCRRRFPGGSFGAGAVFLRAFALAALLGSLPAGNAWAGNVSVSYAIESRGQEATGKLTCDDRERMCVIVSPEMKLRVRLVFDPDMKRVQLSISGEYGRPNCCYFYAGDTLASARVEPGIRRFPFFEGKPRERNEFVVNTPAGTLHLMFLDRE
jgi:hypothetical protein